MTTSRSFVLAAICGRLLGASATVPTGPAASARQSRARVRVSRWRRRSAIPAEPHRSPRGQRSTRSHSSARVGIGLCRLPTWPARVPRSELLLRVLDVGAQALPIVSLISSAVGLILAYIGAVERQVFGAQVYVADLIGVAITREMGAMMIGVVTAWSPLSCARIRRASRCGTSIYGGQRHSRNERSCAVRLILRSARAVH